MKVEQTLTLKEALEQGYTHYCHGHPSNGYRMLDTLEGLTQQDIDEGELYLADKETFAPSGITNEQLKELIAEHIAVNHADDTGDDTDTVYDAVHEIDFSDVEKRINEVLNQHKSFRWITDIKLV